MKWSATIDWKPAAVPDEMRAAISAMEESVRPLVFESDLDEVQLSARGTVTAVGYRGRGFAVTNRHSLDPERLEVPRLCIFSTRECRTILPLSKASFVPRAAVDAESADLVAIELDSKVSFEPTLLLDLNALLKPHAIWAKAPALFLVGFPDHLSNVDYESRSLHLQGTTLLGRYDGPSELPNVHRMRVHDATDHPSFSGWSGSPVFAWMPSGSSAPDLALCGIAVVGSPASGVVHFIDVGVLLWLLDKATTPGAAIDMDGQLPRRS